MSEVAHIVDSINAHQFAPYRVLPRGGVELLGVNNLHSIMRILIIRVYIAIILLMTYANILIADDSDFIASEITGRPTDTSITINAVAKNDVDVFFEFISAHSFQAERTDTLHFSKEIPIKITLTNLRPDTKYLYRMYYRISGEKHFTARDEHTFHTKRKRGREFKFVIQTDSHLYDKKCTPELYRIAQSNQLANEPDFMIDMGDTFGDDHDTTQNRDQIFQLYLDQRQFFDLVCHSIPLFLCIGNHELEYNLLKDGTGHNVSVWAAQARKFYYLNPAPDSFYSGNSSEEEFIGTPENYFSWEWGDALFVVLDAYRYITANLKPRGWDWTIGETQYRWFKQTLEQSDATFKFVFIHHVLGQTRGGKVWADKFEWGGYNSKGKYEFDEKRPGWGKPIHQLMVENGVTILFQGHDHLFAKEELDGVIYQECPMPSDATYHVGSEFIGDYPGALIYQNSGHVLVSVSESEVTVDYIRAVLPEDESDGFQNRDVVCSYTVDANPASIKSSEALKQSIELFQNYPNPFNPSTQISFQLSKDEFVKLSIYNLLGQCVNTLLDKKLEPGNYSIEWSGLNHHGGKVSSGVYFYELKTERFRKIRKAILLQ